MENPTGSKPRSPTAAQKIYIDLIAIYNTVCVFIFLVRFKMTIKFYRYEFHFLNKTRCSAPLATTRSLGRFVSATRSNAAEPPAEDFLLSFPPLGCGSF